MSYRDIFTTKKKYNIIYADPPWKYNDKGCQGAAEKIYPVMTVAEMAALPIKEIADKDCVLFMWATYPKNSRSVRAYRKMGFYI